MNVTCPDCRTEYRVDPEKIPARGVIARCAQCPGEFPVGVDLVARTAAAAGAPVEGTPVEGPVPSSATLESAPDEFPSGSETILPEAEEPRAGFDAAAPTDPGAESWSGPDDASVESDEAALTPADAGPIEGLQTTAWDGSGEEWAAGQELTGAAGEAPEEPPGSLEAYPGDASPDSGAERIAEPVEDQFGASAEDAHASAAIEDELAYQTVNLQDEEGAVPAGESEERPISEEPERSTAGEMVEAVPVAEEDSGAIAHEGPSREAGAAAPAGEPAGGPAAESVAEAGPSDEQREAALYPAGGEAAVSPGFTEAPPPSSDEMELPPPPFGSADPHSRARRLARALVSDIVVYHPDRRERSLREGTLRQEFREEIRKSWDEYVAQVGNGFARETSHFQDALNELLAGGSRLF